LRLILTGAAGQFGRAFLDLAIPHVTIPLVHTATQELPLPAKVADLERPETVADLIRAERPDWVVHAAALTNVDACERDPQQARRVNGAATGVIAQACKDAGARLAYVSTDYVFDGSRAPYHEKDPTHPIQEYGKSKLEGELQALKALPNALICRTSVVFGPHKSNFVVWCTRELVAQRPVRIVVDQRVSPSYTYDLARQVLRLVETWAEGIYHTAGASALSRHEMAVEIAHAFALDETLIQPITSDQLEWVARRPKDSTLSVHKVSAVASPMTFGQALRDLKRRWQP
jgi:dTDP-4-dehydrorhamnose reductase